MLLATSTSPSFAYVSNPEPDSSLCRAAAPRLGTLQLLLPNCIDPLQTAVPHFRPLQLLLTNCVPSAAARHLRSVQLLFPDFSSSRLRPLQLLLPDCVRFNCSSPIASASTTDYCSPIASACSLTCSGRFQPMPNTFFAEFEVQYIELSTKVARH